MMKTCNKPLKTNPFSSYRDPATGRWIVVKGNSASKSQNKSGVA
ncbi:MAG TPA: hypothetical protein V6C84_11555 [Coleofasciculaceae cyanobacterium]|jgi:hypothetical protein